MAQAIRFDHPGEPSVLSLGPVTVLAPGANEALIKHEAVGVNYLDVTQRSGAVKVPLPSGLGLEGAGTVVSVGSGVTNVRPGDRVAYATGPLGGDRVPGSGVTKPIEGALRAKEVGHRGFWLTLSLRT